MTTHRAIAIGTTSVAAMLFSGMAAGQTPAAALRDGERLPVRLPSPDLWRDILQGYHTSKPSEDDFKSGKALEAVKLVNLHTVRGGVPVAMVAAADYKP